MLPKNLQNRVALSCYAIVSGHFASFHNPENRGPKFSWENFPEMMRRHCENGVFLNTDIPERHAKAVKEHAGQTGFEIAGHLVRLMTD